MSSFLSSIFGTSPAATPSPPNMSPAGSPHGPDRSYGPGGAPISPTVVDPHMKLEVSPDELREISQAQGLVEQLMRRSEVPPEYRAQLAPYITKHLLDGRRMPPDQRNTDAVLIFLSSHTCVKTWVKKAFELYKKQLGVMTEEEGKKGAPEILLKATFEGLGMMLGQGFNFIQEPNRKKQPFFKRDP